MNNLSVCVLIGAIILAFYIFYYLTFAVKKPKLYSANGSFREFLFTHCPIVKQTYWPTFWAVHCHLMTVVSHTFRSFHPMLRYYRENILTPDGGLISLDWYDPTGELEKSSLDDTRPIALILPGMTGSSQTAYIRTLVPKAHRAGYRAVVLNNRGLAGNPLLTQQLYCPASVDDLQSALIHIRKTSPTVSLITMGISMGSVITLGYLINSGVNSIIDAAFTVSTPFNWTQVVHNLARKWINIPLNRSLASLLIDVVLKHRHMYESDYDLEMIRKNKSLEKFEAAFTHRNFGFENEQKYMDQCTAEGKLCQIKVPTLCLNAANDTVIVGEDLPRNEISKSSHVAMLVTARGGHIGFMESHLFTSSYYSERLFEQYLNAWKSLPGKPGDHILN